MYLCRNLHFSINEQKSTFSFPEVSCYLGLHRFCLSVSNRFDKVQMNLFGRPVCIPSHLCCLQIHVFAGN